MSCDLCAVPDIRFARKATMDLDITFTLVLTKVNPNLVSENIIKVSKIIFGDSLFTGSGVINVQIFRRGDMHIGLLKARLKYCHRNEWRECDVRVAGEGFRLLGDDPEL